ncbi:MAG: hypothetical protein QM607_04925 [Microbacterium sp.]
MADLALTDSPRSAREVWRSWPLAGRIAAIYIAGRVFTTLLMLLSAHLSPATSRFGSDPSLIDYVKGWDAWWYEAVVRDGYPTELPLDDNGDVSQNTWAFMPIYAKLAGLLGNIFAAGNWWFGALVVSLIAGYLACLALHALLRERMDAGQAQWAVVLFSFGPLAVLFQVGYAEVLFLAALLAAILCVVRRQWRPLYLLVPFAGFTRPGILAFALFLGLYGLWRLLPRQRERMGVPRWEVVHVIALGVLAVAVGFAWQIYAGIKTGDGGAYLETELAWRRGWGSGESGFTPFSGWFDAASTWSWVWGIPGWLGDVLVVLIVIAGISGILLLPAVKRLGGEVQLWSLSHVIYLFAVFFPQTSVFRLLLPLAPLAGALAWRRGPLWRAFTLAACVLAQWGWLWGMYGNGNTFWLIP